MKKGQIYARVNTRITFEQDRFVKLLAKIRRISEAEVYRDVLEQEMESFLGVPANKKHIKEIKKIKK